MQVTAGVPLIHDKEYEEMCRKDEEWWNALPEEDREYCLRMERATQKRRARKTARVMKAIGATKWLLVKS
jgi:hypothetical protein